MKNLETYIFDPEAVDKLMPAIVSEHLRPIARINEDGWLDLAVGVEQEAIAEHQPNLQKLAEALAAHYRIAHNGRPAMAKSIQYGFAIGRMVASKVYVSRQRALMGDNRNAQEKRRLAVYYRDVEPDTLAAFEDADTLPLEMLIDAIDVNTAEKTAALRDLTDYSLVLERDDPDLESAITLGAVVCYTVLAFDKMRSYENSLNNAVEIQRASHLPAEYLTAEALLSLTASNCREEIEGLEAIRISKLSIIKNRLSRSRTS
jgi:hypothetical protein